MRLCNGCGKLRYGKCEKGFEIIKCEKLKDFKRPSKCKVKFKKQAVVEKQTRKNLIKKLDDVFQMYVRYRDNWTCVVCGKHIDPNSAGAKNEMHGGHYIDRGKFSLRWHEANCNAQCKVCNGIQHWKGLQPEYTIYLLRKYRWTLFEGRPIIEFFAVKKNEVVHHSNCELEELIKHYSEKLEKIKRG